MADNVKAASAKENTNLAVIRGILTSVLQPFDVSLNNGGWETEYLTLQPLAS